MDRAPYQLRVSHSFLHQTSCRGEGDDDELQEEQKLLHILVQGAFLVKYHSNPLSTPGPRYFVLDISGRRIYWKSKKKRGADASIYLEAIKEVRIPEKTSSFLSRLRKSSGDDEEMAFSIIYVDEGRYKKLNLVANTPVEFLAWTKGLSSWIQRQTSLSEQTVAWLEMIWREHDINGDGILDIGEVLLLLKRVNVQLSRKKVASLLQSITFARKKFLTFPEFELFFRILSEREDVSSIFKQYAGSNSSEDSLSGSQDLGNLEHSSDSIGMSKVQFRQFLIQEQQMVFPMNEHYDFLFKKYIDAPMEEIDLYQHFYGEDSLKMTLDEFTHFLISDDNPLYKDHLSTKPGISHDMNQPLSHYFISSSHNTYLLGNQLNSKSSVEAYIRVLQEGCRCVEIDCWDGKDDEPVVYHGHTLTSKVLFKDVIIAIERYAFSASPYPLLISLETHCSVPQQRRMAYHLIDILGEKLLDKPLPGLPTDALPSPEQLKYKILIKNKVLPSVIAMDEATLMEYEERVVKGESEIIESGDKVGIVKVDDLLSSLVVYLQSHRFKSLDHEIATRQVNQISSFSETQSESLMGQNKSLFRQYHQQFLSRIYPVGYRVDSSNYNPLGHWAAGCQLVSLNFQTFDSYTEVNRALFMHNGGCGYYLKPILPQQPSPKFISIKIISGRRLPKPKLKKTGEVVDPFVEIKLLEPHSSPVATKRKTRFSTKSVMKNGFNPIWNQEFQFEIHHFPLSFLRLQVRDVELASTTFLGSAVLKLDQLLPGFKQIPLSDWAGHRIPFSSLFVHISFQTLKKEE